MFPQSRMQQRFLLHNFLTAPACVLDRSDTHDRTEFWFDQPTSNSISSQVATARDLWVFLFSMGLIIPAYLMRHRAMHSTVTPVTGEAATNVPLFRGLIMQPNYPVLGCSDPRHAFCRSTSTGAISRAHGRATTDRQEARHASTWFFFFFLIWQTPAHGWW